MQFTVNREAFLKALTPLTRVAPKVGTMPILESVLIETNEDNLILTATDLEVMLRVRLKLDAAVESVRVCIDLKLIQEFVKLSNKTDINVDFEVSEGFIVHVKSGSAKCTISGIDGLEFPKMETLDGTEAPIVTLDATQLRTGLSSIMYAVGNDDLRPAMMGVSLRKNVIASTNGHILSCYEVEGESDVDVVIPRKAASLLSDEKLVTTEQVKFYESGNNYCALLGDYMLYFRLIDAKYPNYEAVIPQENPITYKFDRAAMLSAIKRIGLFSNETTKQIVMSFMANAMGDGVRVKSEDYDFGKSAEELIDADNVDGEDITIGFNGKFLIETLSAINSDEVYVEMSAPNRAAIFRGASHLHIGLVMPVMINS